MESVGDGGEKKRQLTPIGKSVSVSFRVRVVRACVRAKLCGCVRDVLLNAGGSNGKKCGSFSGVGWGSAPFSAIRKGFKEYAYMLLLYTRVL